MTLTPPLTPEQEQLLTDESVIEVTRTLTYRGPRKWVRSTLSNSKALHDGVNEMGPGRFIIISTGPVGLPAPSTVSV